MLPSVQTPSTTRTQAGPDPSWRALYRAGAWALALFVVLTILSIVAAAVTKLPGGPATLPDASATLQYIGGHRTGFIVDQILIQAPVVLTIVSFMALYAALKHLDRASAAIGAVLAIGSVVATLMYLAIAFGLVYLSDQILAATTAAQRGALTSAAEGLLAQFNTLIPATLLWPAGILVISIAMFKGVFHKSVAYIGILTGVAGIIGEVTRPILGAAYGIYGAVLMVWLIAVGWKLFQLSRHPVQLV